MRNIFSKDKLAEKHEVGTSRLVHKIKKVVLQKKTDSKFLVGIGLL
jgi:hypothetical protein